MENKSNFKPILILSLLGIVIYFNSFSVNFIWDDYAIILENPLVKSFSNIGKIFTTNISSQKDTFYRPIQLLTYMIDFFLYRFNYKGYHLTNIILHIASAVILFKLFLAFTKNNLGSFLSAALFLASPLWVESVTYIAGRADVLMALFIFLSFLYFIKNKFFLALCLYVLALFSKEASIIYPFVLLFYIGLFKLNQRKIFYSIANFFIVTGLFIALRIGVIGPYNATFTTYPFNLRLLFFIKAIPQYLSLIFFPVNQHMSYTPDLVFSFWAKEIIFSCAILTGIILLYLNSLRKDKVVAFFIGWFFIFLLPHSGLFPINALFAEHFIYISAAGVFIIFIYYLQKIKSKQIVNLIILGLLSFFSLATIKYNFAWQDEIKFYQRIIKLSPQSFAARNNLGVSYLNKKDFKSAEKLIAESLTIFPGFIDAQLNLARLYYFKNDLSRAIGLAENILKNNPDNFLACNFLGTFYFKSGNYLQAEKYFSKAVHLNNRSMPLLLDLYSFYKSTAQDISAAKIKEAIGRLDRYCLAQVYFTDSQELFRLNNLDNALIMVNEAIKINPYNYNFFNLKGCILRKRGNFKEGFFAFKEALRISPNNWEVYNNLGNLFSVSGDFENAQMYFNKAISLNENFADTYFNLGALYFFNNQLIKAKAAFEKTLTLDSSHTQAKQYINKLTDVVD